MPQRTASLGSFTCTRPTVLVSSSLIVIIVCRASDSIVSTPWRPPRIALPGKISCLAESNESTRSLDDQDSQVPPCFVLSSSVLIEVLWRILQPLIVSVTGFWIGYFGVCYAGATVLVHILSGLESRVCCRIRGAVYLVSRANQYCLWNSET